MNKDNAEVFALLNSSSKANLVSQGYASELPLKIKDTLWRLAIINKHQINTQKMVITRFEAINSLDHTQYFEETFLIANVLQPVVLGILFLKLENLDVS